MIFSKLLFSKGIPIPISFSISRPLILFSPLFLHLFIILNLFEIQVQGKNSIGIGFNSRENGISKELNNDNRKYSKGFYENSLRWHMNLDSSGKNSSLFTQAPGKIERVKPEAVGASSKILKKVDSIAKNSIKRKVFSGCVVLAMKDGKIFYEKAFGTHSYKDKTPTKITDVFDLASVTKVTSTLLGVMKAYEQGLIQLDSPLSYYLPETRNTNKKDIIIKDLLTHQAGLVPFIPFYLEALKEKGVFSKDSGGIFTWRVADGMFERNNYFSETIWPRILESPIKTPGKYVYSDLSMYFMRAVLEKVCHKDLKSLVTDEFYNPLGLTTTGFNPRSHIPLERLIPTENDTLFRKQELKGDVHDPGAAMQNGVAGHAGLFSDAEDLAVLCQMLLNNGEYEGKIYFKPETVQFFNTRPYPKTNRRALGWDKPDLDPSKYTSVPPLASYETFGHTGFTGTCIWVDPRNKLVFIFLSNRVNPDANNNKITELSIRPKIHTVFYEALNSVTK